MGSIVDAARSLPESIAAIEQLPEPDRVAALQALLRTGVHDVVVAATATRDDPPLDELAELAAALISTDTSTSTSAAISTTTSTVTSTTAGIEAGLPPRERIFLRLLRHGAIQPAWALAEEDGAGAVEQRVSLATLSGGTRLSRRLPLTTLVEGDRIHAWLPGFRDPRWTVPDEVYDVTDDVCAECTLGQVRVSGRRLLLAGWAHLTLLHTSAEDAVAVELTAPTGARLTVPATRVRRPDLVKGNGEDLTRLAWAGWQAEIDLAALRAAPGTWGVQLRLTQGALSRTTAIGRPRGPLAGPERLPGPHELAGRSIRAGYDKAGALTLRVQPLGVAARVLPRSVRSAVRRGRARHPG